MWRNIVKQVYSRTHPKFFPFPTFAFLVESAESTFLRKLNRTHFELRYFSNTSVAELGFRRRYASAAEAVAASSTDDDSEVQELLTEVKKEERKQFSHNRKIPKGMGRDKYQRLKNRQVKVETEAWENAAQEYKELLNDMCEKKLAPTLPYMKSLFLGWFEPFCDKVAEEQEFCRNVKYRCDYAPYLTQLPAEKIAIITMHKLMSLLMTGGESGVARVVQASCVIGEAIEQEIRIHSFLERTKKKRGRKKEGSEKDDNVIEEEKLHKKVTDLIKKQKLQAVTHIVKGQDGSKPWNTETRAKLGSRLLDLLLQTAYIQPPADQTADTPPDVRPAFVHTVKTVVKEKGNTSRRYGAIECDPLIRKGLEKTARHMVIPYMPMLVPPVKWTGYDKGAHFYLPSYIMRTHGASQLKDAVKSTPKHELQHVFEALDTLGSTKWRVNKRVLTVIDRIWMNGGRVAGLVDLDDIHMPEKPDTEDEVLLTIWRWKRRSVKKERSEKYSQRCDIELKLSVARKMKEEEGFYYPHNVDFRGRAYPMHPHLNHLGSDVCRGILEFAEGRTLGSSGLRWLKIHLANLFGGGVGKLSLDGRVAFTENHLDEIFESADRPLEGNQWWLKAEDPFQCLAVCISLSEALRSSSPENTLSHIPVHQDGSCNGLQHYAALGRDNLGAAAVNLIGGEKPADVYSEIAARVLNILKDDAQKDPTIFPEALHARVLVNQVDRKLVKQTVMTSVYGVTYVGAREQIKRRLDERNIYQESSELFSASCYAAKATLTALGEMFKSARSIMNWLGDCAKIVASENEPVRWTTPLGLPVVQPYRKFKKHLVRTSLQTLTLQLETEKIMVTRHKTAFPPNFVHSLDGSHMMMTAVACKRAGLNFAGVHDSYWTHACDVDKLNIILRQKFVELYQTPILENLLESFQKSFPTLEFPRLPERGDLDLNNVLASPYFFN